MQLVIDRVSKRFGMNTVLNQISLRVEEGQFVALLGPSGCGKTTLLNALAGLVEVEDGTIAVGGEVWSSKDKMLPPERRNVGMVFQDFALWPHMTVFDNVAFGLKVKKHNAVDTRTRVNDVLDIVQMQEHARVFPHQLSGGQKQRIAIARALAPRPSIMLMDEPLSSLDAKLREQMRWELLKIIQAAGITTVYVTHDQVEALSMADHVVLLNQGRIEQEGAPKELYQRPASSFAATFLGASNLLTGRVAAHHSDRIFVTCNGFDLRVAPDAQSKPVSVADTVTVMIRPSEITLLSSDEYVNKENTTTDDVTVLVATIAQRAFQGTTWQYRATVSGGDEQTIEVWDTKEWSLGSVVGLSIPATCCLIVANQKEPIAVAI